MADDVVVDTYKLNQYAQRVARVNTRISKLDSRLDGLYFRVGLQGLFNLIQADALTCYTLRLLHCQLYLQQTAADFENTEKLILGENPTTFTEFSIGAISTTCGVISKHKDATKDGHMGVLAKFFGNDLKTEGSVMSGEKTAQGEFLGISIAGAVSGDLLVGEAAIKTKASWKFKDENGNWDFKSFDLTTTAYASGALAKGEVEGNLGFLRGKASGQFVTGAVKGEAKVTIWDDGKFNPSLMLGVSAEASLLQGEVEVGFGNDQYGIYSKADGDILHAEAEAKAGVGYLGKDKDGNALYGVSVEANAMASVAQGKVKSGISIFGIDIEVGVKGYAVAAGVKTGGSITTDGVTASFSGALGLGAGLDVSIDWSDAEWVEDTVQWIGDTGEAIGDFAVDTYEAAGDFLSDAGDAIVDGLDYLFGWI